jgi:crossover junction endodeoxyribonuclease RuvC
VERSPQGQATTGDGVVRRVLGVDPGTVCTGWGVVEERAHRVRYVESGVVRLRGNRPDRLAAICNALDELCQRFTPDAVVIEQTFVGDNIQTAFRLGEARGAVMVAAARAARPVVEYSPAEIKVAITGSGRATKEQMQTMVGRLLTLTTTLLADEADALGAAICHLHRNGFAMAVAQAAPRRIRLRGGVVRTLKGLE